MELNERFRLIVKLKAKNNTQFAKMMDWTTAYLSQILCNTTGIGLSPIKEVLTRFPDIDARWLILGEGYVFGTIEQGIIRHVEEMTALKKYVSVMSEEELNSYLDFIGGRGVMNVTYEMMQKWQGMLKEKNNPNNKKIYEIVLSDEDVCKILGHKK